MFSSQNFSGLLKSKEVGLKKTSDALGKGKGKFVPLAVNACKGSKGVGPITLNLAVDGHEC